jgi:3-oxoacyl-[acyl-carrier-protein] synthase II
MVPRGDGTNGTFNPDDWMEPKEQRKVDDFIIFAMAAASQALDDANWHPSTEEERCATGTMIGSGIGGIEGIGEAAVVLKERGPRKLSPFFIPGRLINLASGYVSIKHGLKGPNHAVVTACSTGAHAIGDASRLIAFGDADDGCGRRGVRRQPLAMGGFCALRAMATKYNDNPTIASRPYDKDRDGFVMGEGAGVVVLEYEHAKKRGAKIYAEVVGYGLSGDAYHITAPAEDGDGAYRCMSAAMKRAGVTASDIDYINAHGTFDAAWRRDRAWRCAAAAWQRGIQGVDVLDQVVDRPSARRGRCDRSDFLRAGDDNVAPPTINLDNPSVETAIDLVPKKARQREINVALSNSFGFGGTNASLIVRRLAS